MKLLALLFWFVLLSPAWGAVAYDNASTGTTGAVQTNTLTFSHNNIAGNVIVVMVGGEMNSTPDASCTGVTYNAVALTQKVHVAHGSGFRIVEIWYSTAAPATGSHNVVITCPADITSIVSTAVTATGANASSPLGTEATLDFGSDANPSVDVTSATGDLVVAMAGSNGFTSCTAGTGETVRGDALTTNGIFESYGCTLTEAGAASVTIAPTLNGSSDYRVMAGVGIRAATVTARRRNPIVF